MRTQGILIKFSEYFYYTLLLLLFRQLKVVLVKRKAPQLNVLRWLEVVRAKCSEVWKYFTEMDRKVECKICQAKLFYQSTSKTMRQHACETQQ